MVERLVQPEPQAHSAPGRGDFAFDRPSGGLVAEDRVVDVLAVTCGQRLTLDEAERAPPIG